MNQCFAIVALSTSAALSMLTTEATAQLAPLTEATQESMRRQEERTKSQQQQLQTKVDVLKAASSLVSDTVVPVESPCFRIHFISVVSNRDSKFRFLDAVTTPFLNHCIGVAGVRKIASALDSKLMERGYVTTRVSLANQNLSDGTLRFFLHEGRVENIIMTTTENGVVAEDKAWGTWRNAFPIQHGDLLNIRDLEQGMEQMKRLPSQTIDTKIEPGNAPDASVVRIERQTGRLQDRLRWGLTVDNSGSQALGRGQLSSYFLIDNLAGLNDILSVSSNINTSQPNPDHRSYGIATSYSIPWGYHSLNLSVNTNRFAQYVNGTTARFLSSGKSNSSELQWNMLVLRTASTKFGIYSGLSTRSAESYLDDVELLVQRRRTTSVNVGATYTQFIQNGSFDFNLGYRVGTDWGNAQEDFKSATENGLTIRPRIFSFGGSFNRSFELAKKALHYSAALRGQYTDDTTLSIDQISIGGRNSVRGFDGDGVLLAESGLFVRNELSTALKSLHGIESNAFLALDFGRVSGASASNLVGHSLAGLAVGVRGKWRKLFFDFSLATPIHKPSTFQSSRNNAYLSVTYAK